MSYHRGGPTSSGANNTPVVPRNRPRSTDYNDYYSNNNNSNSNSDNNHSNQQYGRDSYDRSNDSTNYRSSSTGYSSRPVYSSNNYDNGSSGQSESTKRSRFDDGPATNNQSTAESQDEGRDGRKKKRSRWGDDSAKVFVPGVPTILPKGMSAQQTEELLIRMRLEEIGRKLRTGDVVPHGDRRSVSPEPVYGADGKRVNTREYRYRKKLEDERHKLVDDAIKRFPGFMVPADYKRPQKLSDKLYIPARDYPEINFIGLLIGPRGNTLKKMESESGAKISIRGKGSIKEGKSRADGQLAPGEEEELHCLVTADSEDKIKAAIKVIEKIIETAATVPEGQNELKRLQLRELASLNGTLRDDENQICQNCGATGHRRFECPEVKNFTVNLVCRICGGAGHVAKDCTERNNPEALREASQREQKMDHELANMMAEISGGKGPRPAGAAQHSGGARPPWVTEDTSAATAAPLPWAKQDTSAAMANPAAAYYGMGAGMMPGMPWGAAAPAVGWMPPAAPWGAAYPPVPPVPGYGWGAAAPPPPVAPPPPPPPEGEAPPPPPSSPPPPPPPS